MSLDNKAKTVIWSLQNNKRSEATRNAFQPNGKNPKNKKRGSLFSVLGITFLMSFLLTLFSKEALNFCFFSDVYCFNSITNPLVFVVFVFLNLWVLLVGVGVAYWFGKKIANRFKI